MRRAPWIALAAVAASLLGRPAQAGVLGTIREKLGLGGAAPAARPLQPTARANRVHLLTPELWGHLKPAAQRNQYALVHYSGAEATGSGVVVGAWQGNKPGTLRALVLTSRHVIDGNHDQHALTFTDGTQVHASKVVAQNRFLDYALLEVELPDTARVAEALPSTALPAQGARIYSMGAATSMLTYPMESFVAGGRATRLKLRVRMRETGLTDHETISAGRTVMPGPAYTRLSNGKRAYILESDAASAPGASGGPVFDATTHALVGINASGYRDARFNESGMATMAYIAHDLAKQYNRGRVDPASRDTVGDLLGRLYPQGDAPR